MKMIQIKDIFHNKSWNSQKEAGRRKGLHYLAGFFIFMLIMSIISRAIYVYGLPRVEKEEVSRKVISHTVAAEGKIEKKQELAINIAEGIRVEEVLVKEGERIFEQDPVLVLSSQDLQEKTESLKTEIEKLNLQISDLETNERLSNQKKELEKKRAREGYDSAASVQGQNVANAQKEKDSAQSEKDSFPSREAYIKDAVKHSQQVQQVKDKVESLKEEYDDLDSRLNAMTEETEEKALLKQQKKEKKAELAAAKEEYSQAEKSAEQEAGMAWEEQKKALEAALGEKEAAYANAVLEKEEALKAADQQMEDAAMPREADSTMEVSRLELKEKEKELAKYQGLLEGGGIVKAEKNAQITAVKVLPGEKTTEGAALLYAPEGEAMDFCMLITEEEQKYVSAGDSIELSFQEGKKIMEDLTVEGVVESELETGMYEIHVTVPPEGLSIGERGTGTVIKQSQSYDYVVSLKSLHAGENNSKYVLIVDSEETILGEELVLRKVEVNVLDQNDTAAAIEPGGLTGEEAVVVSSDKIVADKDHVRLLEE